MFRKGFSVHDLLTADLIKHPSRVPAKPVPTTTYLWIKVSLARKDYVKNINNGGRWRWEILALKLRGDV